MKKKRLRSNNLPVLHTKYHPEIHRCQTTSSWKQTCWASHHGQKDQRKAPPSFSFEFWFSSMLKQFCPWKVVHFRMRCYCPSLNWFCSNLFLRRFGPPTKLADQLCWSNPICSSELPNKSISYIYIYTLSNCLFWWFLLTNLSPNLTKSFNSCLVRSSKSKKKSHTFDTSFPQVLKSPSTLTWSFHFPKAKPPSCRSSFWTTGVPRTHHVSWWRSRGASPPSAWRNGWPGNAADALGTLWDTPCTAWRGNDGGPSGPRNCGISPWKLGGSDKDLSTGMGMRLR